jgi:hypothetical protein
MLVQHYSVAPGVGVLPRLLAGEIDLANSRFRIVFDDGVNPLLCEIMLDCVATPML